MRLAASALVALIVVASASAGATAPRPSVALTASPARVSLAGREQATVRVSNAGTERVVVVATRAGFALDLRGRPKIVPTRRSRAEPWLRVRPRRFALRAGGSASLVVAARPPRRAPPGDHSALVLLTTRRRAHGRVAVRMRLGVVVDLRVPGRIVRSLAVRGLLVRTQGRRRLLEVLVANRGNVKEDVGAGRSTLSLAREGRPIATLRAEQRELLPRTRGLVLFRYRGRARGPLTALVTLVTEDGRTRAQRVFRLRL